MERNLNLIINDGKGFEVVLSQIFYNDEKQLEFKEGFKGFNQILNLDNMELELYSEGKKKFVYDLKDRKEFLEKARIFKRQIEADISAFYKNLLSGKEELICFPIETSTHKYLITTNTLLNNSALSIKYLKGFEYAVSIAFKNANEELSTGYSDIQQRLGDIINSVNLKTELIDGEKVVKTTLPELLNIVAKVA